MHVTVLWQLIILSQVPGCQKRVLVGEGSIHLETPSDILHNLDIKEVIKQSSVTTNINIIQKLNNSLHICCSRLSVRINYMHLLLQRF